MRVTTYGRRAHNDAVRLRLLALLFCVTAGAALAQTVPPSADNTTRATAEIFSERQAGVPGSTGDSDSRWNAGYRADASVTESLWKFSVVHADLAAAPSGGVSTEAYTANRRDRPARNRLAHLRHIPLLI